MKLKTYQRFDYSLACLCSACCVVSTPLVNCRIACMHSPYAHSHNTTSTPTHTKCNNNSKINIISYINTHTEYSAEKSSRCIGDIFTLFHDLFNQAGSIGPMNHISPGPIYYPKSPAIFTPILTAPQFTQGRINTGITFSPDKHSSGGHVTGGVGIYHHHHQQQVDGHKLDPGEGSSTGAVSRCSSNETIVVQNQHTTAGVGTDPASSQGSYFTFPLLSPWERLSQSR